MKKIISLFTVIALVSNTAFASSVTNPVTHDQMIAKAFDGFRYQMTVAVDPTDSQFQAKATENFKMRMAELQAKGISSEEVMNYMRASMLDVSTRNEFDRMLKTMSFDQVSSEQAGNMAMQFMAGKYQQGASYAGGGKGSMKIALIVIGVVIVGVVTYLVVKHIQDQKKIKELQAAADKTKTVTDTLTKTDTLTTTSVQTSVETVTNVSTVTETSVETKVETINNTETVTSYNTVISTYVYTDTETVTNFNTITNYSTVTETYTDTQTFTQSFTETVTNTVTEISVADCGYCDVVDNSGGIAPIVVRIGAISSSECYLHAMANWTPAPVSACQ